MGMQLAGEASVLPAACCKQAEAHFRIDWCWWADSHLDQSIHERHSVQDCLSCSTVFTSSCVVVGVECALLWRTLSTQVMPGPIYRCALSQICAAVFAGGAGAAGVAAGVPPKA